MKFFWSLILFAATSAWADEAFKIQLHDRMIRVESASKSTERFAVIIENLSLSDVTGKFVSAGKDLKFVSIKSTQSKTVEFNHKGNAVVSFQALAPAFQEVSLVFGKGAYEIPPKQ